jgi:Flp pilus assembly protein TadD
MTPKLRLACALSAVLIAGGCAGTAPLPEETASPVRAEPPQALLEQAEADVAARRFKMAEQRLARLDQATAEQPRAQYAIAEVLLGLGQPKDALQKFDALQKDAVFGGRAQQGMGLSLLAMEDAAAAEAPLQRAVSSDPNLWRAWTALGRIHDQQGRWSEADEAYAKALKASPSAAMVVNNMGMSKVLQHRYDEAAALFQKALAEDPGLDTARSNLRIALAWQGRYEEALLGAEDAERSDALNNVGYIAMLRGDYRESQKYLAQAIAGSPTYHVAAVRNLDMLKLLVRSQGKAPTP